jgi:hypothetical protein
LEKSKIVDTNSAGDAFVGGLLVDLFLDNGLNAAINTVRLGFNFLGSRKFKNDHSDARLYLP